MELTRAIYVHVYVCAVQGLSKAVKQVLLPIMKSIKDDLNSVKGELTSLNETVSHLSGDLEQHKNQTTSVLADLQSSINRSSAVTEELREAEDRLVNQLENLDTKLTSFDNTLMRGDLSSVKRELTSLNESMKRICDKMEEHEDHMTTEIMELEEHLQRNFTRQLKHSYGYITSLPQSCDGTGGWRRAVYLDMTDTRTSCPEGWNMTDYSKRTCGRATDGRLTCDSVTFSVSGGEYSQVCGRIRAYQWGIATAFYGSRFTTSNSVDGAYITGVAVMHGSPRQHIWTFAVGRDENYPWSNNVYLCPCDGIRSDLLTIPPFVGEDYFCESGAIYPNRYSFYSNDILWDGRDCHSSSTCCSRRNPPYFVKTLNTSTTDDIELRMCFYQEVRYSNVAVELVELYVK